MLPVMGFLDIPRTVPFCRQNLVAPRKCRAKSLLGCGASEAGEGVLLANGDVPRRATMTNGERIGDAFSDRPKKNATKLYDHSDDVLYGQDS